MASTSPRQVAIITGAAQGIGRSVSLRLAKDGLDLALFDLPKCQNLLEELAASIRAEHGARVITVYGDVSVEEDIKKLVDTTTEQLGDLYAMIANAGTANVASLHETTTEMFDKLMNINVKGVFFSYKYALLRLLEQGKGGRIVGAASISGKRGSPDQPVYSATKFAIRGLTQSAARDYGKYGITVNAYAPGLVDTPLWTLVDEMHSANTGAPKGSWPGSPPKNALGRVAQPEDIAKLVSFLVSDDAAFITGQSYNVDGGEYFD
ncbi:acetoin reductase family protein [Dichomitus squalens LYAD-421 SS1]|uniref:acetoin reductase family protein n=1 Tax=Dichomitus squalens (strain LYAD-421) TaxID=732165 RepID=UPI000441516C|nr:acetoin reductase family protein [Dichomitus squalens LYAD-421 SS1]EJF63724.1 acetoin reductase family protein [Dichomitus squalens LYAD-421 SS1]